MSRLIPGLLLLSCCASAPETKKLVEGRSEDKCFLIVSAYCEALHRCAPNIGLGDCETALAPSCAGVTGISDDEMEACIKGLDSVACEDEFPRACLGIAGPKEER